MRIPTFVFVIASCLGIGNGCSVTRSTSAAPTYDGSVASLLTEKCVSCHGDDAPAAGFRASTYLDVIGCTAAGTPVTLPASAASPIVQVLSDTTHSAILSSAERDELVNWVSAGAPKFTGTAHAPSFVDPRSPASHGRQLRAKHWSPMLDPNDPESCGRCHDGAPSRPAGVTSGAPSAPACTTCHQESGGALGCNTCHGRGVGEGPVAAASAKNYPPRDLCFFPEDATIVATHAPHVDSTATHFNGVACSSCHPIPGATVIGGTHGDGIVEIALDVTTSGPSAMYDPATEACATTCHARPGGARPHPAWTEQTPMTCGDCHSSPPPNHLAGACTNCHRETNATGTGFLGPATLHINGHVDLGDGSGKCGECHGSGDSAWPSTNAHPAHQNPAAAAAAPCVSCHTVPTAYGTNIGHPSGAPATILFSGLAVQRGTAAAYSNGACSQVYCHGAGLEGTVAATPVWTDESGAASACGACHTLPPAAPHPASPACGLCHSDAVVTATGPLDSARKSEPAHQRRGRSRRDLIVRFKTRESAWDLPPDRRRSSRRRRQILPSRLRGSPAGAAGSARRDRLPRRRSRRRAGARSRRGPPRSRLHRADRQRADHAADDRARDGAGRSGHDADGRARERASEAAFGLVHAPSTCLLRFRFALDGRLLLHGAGESCIRRARIVSSAGNRERRATRLFPAADGRARR